MNIFDFLCQEKNMLTVYPLKLELYQVLYTFSGKISIYLVTGFIMASLRKVRLQALNLRNFHSAACQLEKNILFRFGFIGLIIISSNAAYISKTIMRYTCKTEPNFLFFFFLEFHFVLNKRKLSIFVWFIFMFVCL